MSALLFGVSFSACVIFSSFLKVMFEKLTEMSVLNSETPDESVDGGDDEDFDSDDAVSVCV